MELTIKGNRLLYTLATSAVIFSSCQKANLNNTAATTAVAALSSTIAVAATADALSLSNAAPADSVYLLQPCERGGGRDSVAKASLPGAIAVYIAANYQGAVFNKAFAISDNLKQLTGFVVVIYFNNKPVGLQFDGTGNFVKVLEQRERGDLAGSGHHGGGRFEHRDGNGRDSINLNNLPLAVTAYFAANYPADTLIKALRDNDSSIVILSKNNGLFATTFSSANVFIERKELQKSDGNCVPIALADVLKAAIDYLAVTYPNYVFEKAFSIATGSTTAGFIVVIDTNNTKYAVEFDSTGNFINARTIR